MRTSVRRPSTIAAKGPPMAWSRSRYARASSAGSDENRAGRLMIAAGPSSSRRRPTGKERRIGVGRYGKNATTLARTSSSIAWSNPWPRGRIAATAARRIRTVVAESGRPSVAMRPPCRKAMGGVQRRTIWGLHGRATTAYGSSHVGRPADRRGLLRDQGGRARRGALARPAAVDADEPLAVHRAVVPGVVGLGRREGRQRGGAVRDRRAAALRAAGMGAEPRRLVSERVPLA